MKNPIRKERSFAMIAKIKLPPPILDGLGGTE
jgi:hypothetical protein